MGRVYKAYDPRGRGKVAIKVFPQQEGVSSPSLAEFSALFRLNHPHLPQVYQEGKTDRGRDYLVMELIEGRDILSYVWRAGYEHLLPILLQICETLEFIHSRGYVHSDIKPGHILIDQGGDVKIIDLGLANTIDLPSGGKIRGSLGYIAPEVLKGLRRDHRADLYSLGVVLYEVWTRRKPFPYKETGRLLEAYLHERPTPPFKVNPRVPSSFNHTILKLLEREPAQRFQSAIEIMESLNPGDGRRSHRYFKYEFQLPQGQFTGREKELEELLLGYQQIKNGGTSPFPPPTFLIQGEEGIGKTRLLREFNYQLQVRREGFLLVEVLRERKFSSLDSTLPNLDILDFQQRGSFIPYLLRSGISSFIKGLTVKLAEVAQDQPLILLFDDLEKADELWWEFWEFSAGRIPNVIFIGTYQGGGIDPQGRFSLMRESLRQRGGVQELKLGSLQGEELVSLITSILGMGEIGPLVKVVEEQTGGNPLFVEETLSLLADMNLIYRNQGKWKIREEKLKHFPLPGGTKEVLKRRIRLLKPPERRLLEEASVIGYRFDQETLCQISGLAEIEEQLGGLWRAQLILREEDHPDRFRFSNRMLHRVVYEGMNGATRVKLHRRLGEYLRRVRGEDKRFFMDIAHHLLNGNRRRESLPWFLKAGNEYAHHLSDYGKTITCYEESIKIIEEEYGKMPWRLHQRKGKALFFLGEYEQAWKEFHSIFQISRQRENRIWEVRGQNGMGLVCYCLGRYKEAFSYLKNALQAVKPLHKRELEIEITNNLSRVNQSLGHTQRAIQGHKRALHLSKILGDEERMEDTLLNLGYLYTLKGDYSQALYYFRRGKRIARKRGDKGGEAYAHLGRGNVHFYRSSFPLALRYYRAALSWAEEVGDQWMKGVSLNNISRIYIALGQYVKAMELNEKAREVLKEVGDRRGEALGLINRGTIYLQRAMYEKSKQYLSQALMISQEINFPRGIAWSLSNLAEVHLSLGDLQTAKRFLGEAWEIARRLEDKELRAKVFIGLAGYKLLTGSYPEAEIAIQRALAISQKIKYVEFILSSLFLRSQLEMKRANLKKALRLTNRAGEVARSWRRRHDLARALLLMAQIQIEDGNLEKARSCSQTAKKIAQSHGMKGIWWKAQYQLGRASYYQGRFEQAKREYEECFQMLQGIISEIEEEKFREAYQGRQEIISFAQDVELLRRAI